MEPWGQIATLGVLERYGRNQFEDPNRGIDFMKKENERSDTESDSSNSVREKPLNIVIEKILDSDHQMLLKSCKNLCFTTNGAVMMAVSSLMFSLAPFDDFIPVLRAMMGHLGRRKEVDFSLLQ